MEGFSSAGTEINVTLPYSNKTIVCVEFPGKVQNVDNMMKCFGGIDTISKVMADSSKRLELRFRPDDPYCHCCTGEAVQTQRLLLKVRRRRRKRKSGVLGSGKSLEEMEVHYESEVVAIVDTTYKFKNFLDFQYLPMVKTKSGEYESLLDKIVPTQLEDSAYFKRDVPLFLLPEIFSRVDTPCDYNYRQEKQARIMKSKILQEAQLFGTDRDRRNNNAIFLKFDDKGIPYEPMQAAIETLKRYKLEEKVEKMRKLFQERPIWSRTALMGFADLEFKNLRVILPRLAYYFVTGPWRALWCRIGYDPRRDPKAKIYQMLDFRVRLSTRSLRPAFSFKADVTDLPTQLPRALFRSRRSHIRPSKLPKLPKNHYVFTLEVLPPFYQMYYQVCDLEVDELQCLVHANDGCEKTCDERDGWLLPDTRGKMRDLMHDMVTEKVKEIHSMASAPQVDEEDPSMSISDEEGEEEEEEEDGEDGEEEEEGEEEIDDEMVKEILEYIQPRDETICELKT